jgi:hypothetical protein
MPYPNRTDLPGKPLPVTTVPNQPYGVAGQQQAAQAALPMAGAPQPPPGTQTQLPADAQPQVPMPGAAPGSFGAFTRPTERPGEPPTAGLPIGAGPGPNPLLQPPDSTIVLLNSLANAPGASPEVQALAAYVNTGRR